MSVTDPQTLVDKLEWEGWPYGITWFQDDDFEDKTLSRLVGKANALNYELEEVHRDIMERCEELGAELP